MKYNWTYLGHRVTLPELDLRSNFDLDLSRSNYTWFDAPWRDKHDRVTTVALSFKTNTLSSKTHFGQIWPFDLWWPQFWPELKNDRSSFRIIFPELSNYVFCFVLRCAGAELDRGCSNTPPPPSGGGKSRCPLGRGLIKFFIVLYFFSLWNHWIQIFRQCCVALFLFITFVKTTIYK